MPFHCCALLPVLLFLLFAVYRKEDSHRVLTLFIPMVFGGWLVVALEFQLAADIVGTIVSPTTAHLVELGAIAVIRTFLNYFLGKELREEREITLKRIEKTEKVIV